MKESMAFEKLAKLMKERQWILPLCVFLSAGQAVSLGILFFKEERVVVIPSTVYQEFWIEKNKASSSYLQEMGVFLTQLWLNLTPDTAKTSFLNFLKYVSPASTGEVKNYFYHLDEKIKKNSLCLNFIPQKVDVQSDSSQITVSGELNEYVGDKRIRKSEKKYVIHYEILYGRFFVTHLYEVQKEEEGGEKK